MDLERYRLAPGSPVDLAAHDPSETGGIAGGKDAARARLEILNRRLDELQELLFADRRHGLLVVLQGMDTSGKDGTVRHVFAQTSPLGVHVANFKRPTDEELAHDYLWRVHRHTPARGEIAIFNRSHYEDVLVTRVHGLISPEVCARRYQHLREFERLLADEGTTVVKCFLHISKDEQRERLQSRLDDPTKRWKFAEGDIDERRHWDGYQEAYEALLAETTTGWAPWHVIPADHKWYRNLVISELLIATLEHLDLRYPETATQPPGRVIE